MQRTRKIAAIVIIAFITPMVVWASNNGPEEMDLKARFSVDGNKKAVIFPHRKHQSKLECVKCHVNPEGGGKLQVEIVKKNSISNDFHKNFCWPCHVDMKVPKGKSCSTCH